MCRIFGAGRRSSTDTDAVYTAALKVLVPNSEIRKVFYPAKIAIAGVRELVGRDLVTSRDLFGGNAAGD
jgi:hypothetical protein